MPRKKQDRNVAKARELRRAMSLPEVLLWRLLKGSPQGVKFRRQHPIGKYYLDFYCASANVAIEIDGISHDMGDRTERDPVRDAWLCEQGFNVMRIPATDVLRSPEQVAESLVQYCQCR